jgi:hypothetical protein
MINISRQALFQRCLKPFTARGKMMKADGITFLFTLLIITQTISYAHAHNLYVMRWHETYGGNWPDIAHSAQQTNDNGYIIAGQTSSFGAGGIDFYLVKTDSNGNMQWNKTYGGTDQDEAFAVRQTSDGGYVIAGTTNSFGARFSDFWVVKTDSNGNTQWNKTYGGLRIDVAYSIQQTIDGGYMVAGTTNSFGSGSNDFWLIKTDPNGGMQWNKAYGGLYEDVANSVQQTSDGGYIVCGYTSSFGKGLEDFWLVKTDSNGNMQWNKTYGGKDGDYAHSVQQTTDNGYIIAGSTYSLGAGLEAWLVKTDSSGSMQWNKNYGGSLDDEAYEAQQTSDGGYIIAGFTDSFANNRDIWLIKTDSSGNVEWNRTYGGNEKDEACVVQQTSDGGYMIAGTTYSFGASWDPDFWLIKLIERGLPADVNGDGTVNRLDADAVAKSFGSRSGDISWNLDADIDGNGIINILDVTLVAKSFGKSV